MDGETFVPFIILSFRLCGSSLTPGFCRRPVTVSPPSCVRVLAGTLVRQVESRVCACFPLQRHRVAVAGPCSLASAPPRREFGLEARCWPPCDAVQRCCCHVGMETGEGATRRDLPAGGGQVEHQLSNYELMVIKLENLFGFKGNWSVLKRLRFLLYLSY